MESIEEILESIETKRRKPTEDIKRVDNPSKFRGVLPIPGYNFPLDSSWLTEHLSDEDFKKWYNHKQTEWWDEFKEEGIEVVCAECGRQIKQPKEMIKWAGVVYHGRCFIDLVEEGKRTLSVDDQGYYRRIKKLVFGTP